jgi:hypothetical protein
MTEPASTKPVTDDLVNDPGKPDHSTHDSNHDLYLCYPDFAVGPVHVPNPPTRL